MAKQGLADKVYGTKLTVNLNETLASKLKKNAADVGITQADAVRKLAAMRSFKEIFGGCVKRRIDRNERRCADEQSISE